METSLEIIQNQLLAALDDKSKVAIVVDADDLGTLIRGLRRLVDGWDKKGKRLLADLEKLQEAAFKPEAAEEE